MEEVILKVAEVLVGALGLLLAYLGTKLAQWVSAKVANEYLRGVLTRLTDTVFAVVKELEQTLASELKAASADGKLDDIEKQRLKDAALRMVKSYIGAKGLGELAKVLGFDAAQIDAFLGTRVEAAVHDLHAASVTRVTESLTGAPKQPPGPR